MKNNNKSNVIMILAQINEFLKCFKCKDDGSG